jgi:23S rRNA (pseudouridine1915-N3)-methyltransferase
VRYRVVAVGKVKRGFVRDGCDRYIQLLSSLTQFELVEVRDHSGLGPTEARRRHDTEMLAAAEGVLVALDERGTLVDTATLAKRIEQFDVRGDSRMTLFIGGPDGHGEELHAAVHQTWSLSPLTFPHELARLILLEQLYRVESLRAGHPYHRP